MITKKILTVVILPVVLMIALALVVMFKYTYPEFKEIDLKQASTNSKRVKDILNRELEHIAQFNKDWAEWDDAYQFLIDKNPDFIESNLIEETYISNEVNLIAYSTSQSDLIYFKFYDLPTQKTYFEDKSIDWKFDNILNIKPDKKERTYGFHFTEIGILMLSACPVNTSTVDTVSIGTMYVGKLLTPEVLKSLRKIANINFDISWNNKFFKEAEKALNNIYIEETSPEYLTTFAYLECINNQNVIQIKTVHPRKVSVKGKETILISWVIILTIIVILLVIMIISIEFIVLKPLQQLKAYTLTLSDEESSGNKIFENRNDEFGILADEVYRTASNLRKARNVLSTLSYKAGLSDMSGTFIHNIRNSLTPVVNLVEKLQTLIKSMHVERFEKVFNELMNKQIHNTDADLMEYLKLSIQSLYQSQEQSRMSIVFLNEKLRAIEKLLTYHEEWTTEESIMEKLTIRDILDEIEFLITESSIRCPWDISSNIDDKGKVVELIKTPYILALTKIFEFLEHFIKDCHKILIIFDLNIFDSRLNMTIRILNAGEEFINIKETFDREFLINNDYQNLHWCANTINKLNGSMSLSISDDTKIADLYISMLVKLT